MAEPEQTGLDHGGQDRVLDPQQDCPSGATQSHKQGSAADDIAAEQDQGAKSEDSAVGNQLQNCESLLQEIQSEKETTQTVEGQKEKSITSGLADLRVRVFYNTKEVGIGNTWLPETAVCDIPSAIGFDKIPYRLALNGEELDARGSDLGTLGTLLNPIFTRHMLCFWTETEAPAPQEQPKGGAQFTIDSLPSDGGTAGPVTVSGNGEVSAGESTAPAGTLLPISSSLSGTAEVAATTPELTAPPTVAQASGITSTGKSPGEPLGKSIGKSASKMTVKPIKAGPKALPRFPSNGPIFTLNEIPPAVLADISYRICARIVLREIRTGAYIRAAVPSWEFPRLRGKAAGYASPLEQYYDCVLRHEATMRQIKNQFLELFTPNAEGVYDHIPEDASSLQKGAPSSPVTSELVDKFKQLGKNATLKRKMGGGLGGGAMLLNKRRIAPLTALARMRPATHNVGAVAGPQPSGRGRGPVGGAVRGGFVGRVAPSASSRGGPGRGAAPARGAASAVTRGRGGVTVRGRGRGGAQNPAHRPGPPVALSPYPHASYGPPRSAPQNMQLRQPPHHGGPAPFAPPHGAPPRPSPVSAKRAPPHGAPPRPSPVSAKRGPYPGSRGPPAPPPPPPMHAPYSPHAAHQPYPPQQYAHPPHQPPPHPYPPPPQHFPQEPQYAPPPQAGPPQGRYSSPYRQGPPTEFGYGPPVGHLGHPGAAAAPTYVSAYSAYGEEGGYPPSPRRGSQGLPGAPGGYYPPSSQGPPGGPGGYYPPGPPAGVSPGPYRR